MVMLAMEDVSRAVAFEPSPANLFYLTSSVLANPGFSAKLSLHAKALGNASTHHQLYSERGNAGHTVLEVPTHAKQRMGYVDVVTLDGVFASDNTFPYIHLAKIDVEGYEVKVFKGATALLASGAVNAWKFELRADWLHAQNTSAAELLNVFIENDYQIYEESLLPISDDRLHEYGCAPPLNKEFVALRRAPDTKWQHVVACESSQRRTHKPAA